MIRNRRLNSIFVSIVAVSAALIIATGRADAQVKPFKVTAAPRQIKPATVSEPKS